MPRPGRKRRQCRRTPKGQPSRAGIPTYDRGTERAQAMQALYGTDGADAIGRAYRAGLLGESTEAEAILDTARRVANAYWQAYSVGHIGCPIADRSSGGVAILDHERIRRREEWLREVLHFVNSMGAESRRAFDALVIHVNPDSGPPWLDRILSDKRRGKEPAKADARQLRAALDVLEQLVA